MIFLHPKAMEYLKTMNIKPVAYMSDYHSVDRTLWERWFSRPWHPFKRTKTVYLPTALVAEGIVYVSYRTYNMLRNENNI